MHDVAVLHDVVLAFEAHLAGILGAVLAVAALREQFRAYHAAGLALVLAGIGVAERFRPRSPTATVGASSDA